MTNVSAFNGIEIRGRDCVKIYGIVSVDSFDENQITAATSDGTLVVVDGASLLIKDVNLDDGFLEASGTIQGINYYEKNPIKKSFWAKTVFGAK